MIGELDALVAAHPLREHLHAQRMLALYRCRPPVRGARGLPRRARRARRGDRRRAGRRAAAAARGDPRPGPGARPARVGRRRAGAAPRPPPRRRRGGCWSAPPLLLLAGITAFGVIRVLEPDGLAGHRREPVGLIDPDGGRITTQYAVGAEPERGRRTAAARCGSPTRPTAPSRGSTATRDEIGDDPGRRRARGARVRRRLAVGGRQRRRARSRRSIPAPTRSCRRIDGRQRAARAGRRRRARCGSRRASTGASAGSISTRPRRTRRSAVGANPTAIAAGAGALWVASEEAGTVTRIDPRTRHAWCGRSRSATGRARWPSARARCGSSTATTGRCRGSIPRRTRSSWTVGVGQRPDRGGRGRGRRLGGRRRGGDRRPRRPATGCASSSGCKTGSSPAAIAVAGGSVWAAADAPQAAHRGGTLRVLVPHAPGRGRRSTGCTRRPTRLARRSQLELAGLRRPRRLPARRGRRRRHARRRARHDGAGAEPRRPDLRLHAAARAALLRRQAGPARRTSGPRWSASCGQRDRRGSSFPPFYAGIVGARRCMRRPARCDLSRGIETDARGAHDHHPPDPPGRGVPAQAHACPSRPSCPPTAPVAPRRACTPPGTGPYRVAAWDARRGGTLVRNPHFRSSPARSRGPGFADRIEVRLHDDRTIERQIAAVQRGAADLASSPTRSAATLTREPPRARWWPQSPGRVHSDSGADARTGCSSTCGGARSTTSGVRRAVNLAIDRAQRRRARGRAARSGTPPARSCRPAFPGHEPYCPYTAPTPAGRGWTAPDLERARRLVAASGRAGERVVVLVRVAPRSSAALL